MVRYTGAMLTQVVFALTAFVATLAGGAPAAVASPMAYGPSFTVVFEDPSIRVARGAYKTVKASLQICADEKCRKVAETIEPGELPHFGCGFNYRDGAYYLSNCFGTIPLKEKTDVPVGQFLRIHINFDGQRAVKSNIFEHPVTQASGEAFFQGAAQNQRRLHITPLP